MSELKKKKVSFTQFSVCLIAQLPKFTTVQVVDITAMISRVFIELSFVC